jgi:trimethylamine--corrinoid protein Co-methyltransferase
MHPPLRPSLRVLSDSLAHDIIEEAHDLLAKVGIFVENEEGRALLHGGGARVEASSKKAYLSRQLVEKALASAPPQMTMYDVAGTKSFLLGNNDVHFDPGSAALTIFDHRIKSQRPAITGDLVRFARLTDRLENFHFQSTGIVSSDVPVGMADCYRLFIALRCCSKPVVTGTFVVQGFQPMKTMLEAVRGSSEALRKKPLAIFDACPSPPLKWSNLTTQSIIDCARAGIPSEFVAMPLAGATAPATLSGALVQHTAENLAGLVITQLAAPGAPVIFGGSPAIFDMRAATPPMGAVESMMISIGYTQIGKTLGLPTHGYMGLSDAKCVDAQAGLESGIGTILAALAGVNVVSGGGMMDYESCQSLEKLVIDNEICGMAYRLINGITQRDERMALDLFMDLGESTDFLTHPHTLQWFREEQFMPKIVNRENYQQWVAAEKPDLADLASKEAASILSTESHFMLSEETVRELNTIIIAHAKPLGLARLPPLS